MSPSLTHAFFKYESCFRGTYLASAPWCRSYGSGYWPPHISRWRRSGGWNRLVMRPNWSKQSSKSPCRRTNRSCWWCGAFCRISWASALWSRRSGSWPRKGIKQSRIFVGTSKGDWYFSIERTELWKRRRSDTGYISAWAGLSSSSTWDVYAKSSQYAICRTWSFSSIGADSVAAQRGNSTGRGRIDVPISATAGTFGTSHPRSSVTTPGGWSMSTRRGPIVSFRLGFASSA